MGLGHYSKYIHEVRLKRLPTPTPQGQAEQIGRGTREEGGREGGAGELKKSVVFQ